MKKDETYTYQEQLPERYQMSVTDLFSIMDKRGANELSNSIIDYSADAYNLGFSRGMKYALNELKKSAKKGK